jgi:hypothetical protein
MLTWEEEFEAEALFKRGMSISAIGLTRRAEPREISSTTSPRLGTAFGEVVEPP